MSRGPSLKQPGRLLAIVASVAVATTIAVALLTLGSPSQQRQVRLDQRRVEDLQRIDRLAALYWRSHGTLPADLSTLASQPGQRLAITDPVDAAPYAYAVTGTRRFRLCAVFATDTAHRAGPEPLGEEWNHGIGRHCFDRSVRPEPHAATR